MDSASWLRSFYPSVSVPSWEFGTVQRITWKAASAAGGFLCVRLCFAPDSTYKVLYGFLWSLFTFAANSDKPIFLFEILSKSEKRIWSLDVCVFAATLSSTAEALTWCCFFALGHFSYEIMAPTQRLRNSLLQEIPNCVTISKLNHLCQ